MEYLKIKSPFSKANNLNRHHIPATINQFHKIIVLRDSAQYSKTQKYKGLKIQISSSVYRTKKKKKTLSRHLTLSEDFPDTLKGMHNEGA